jgi:outer membrane protein assembly factor BamB
VRLPAVAALALTLGSTLAPAGRPAGVTTPGTDGAALAWPQWGGPNRNFVTAAADLAPSWPATGPRRLWARPLGDGFSSIVTDGATVYTLARDRTDDAIVALDAKTGTPRWTTKYAAPFKETCSEQLGPAPRAAPLVAGDRLITISAGGLMNSVDRTTGTIQWTRDVLEGSPEALRACGYSSSPIAYKNTVITTAGGPGRGVVAFDLATGKTAWQAQDFQNGYSSPIIIDLDGRPELVVFTYGDIAGLNPDTGALEWSRPHKSDQGVNVATPIWGDDHLLFISSAYGGGSRVLKLARAGGAVSVEEVWANQRVRIHFGNAVRIGGRIFASNGDMGSAPFAAIDVKTGDTLWRDRSVTRATLIGAGNQLVLLDEDGNLALASPGDAGLELHGKTPLLKERAWTAPTLSGTTLFVRDRHQIMALDLGR